MEPQRTRWQRARGPVPFGSWKLPTSSTNLRVYLGCRMRRIGILTSGGDCPGLNAVIRAVVKTAHEVYGAEVVGICDGFLGLLPNGVTRTLSLSDARGILAVGGTIL